MEDLRLNAYRSRQESEASSLSPSPISPKTNPCIEKIKESLHISVESNSPYSPKLYGINATAILSASFFESKALQDDQKTPPSEKKRLKIYEIRNALNIPCKITPLLSSKGMPVHGNFSCLYVLNDPIPRACPGINNQEIIIKILRNNHLNHARQSIDLSIDQYRSLNKYFRKKREHRPPIIPILNPDTAPFCGYMIVERAQPFTEPPWDATTQISEFSVEQRRYFNTIVSLIRASDALERKGKSGLDLKWDNLGTKNGRLVLLDYVNTRFTFNSVIDSYPKRLGGNNPEIEKALSKKAFLSPKPLERH